MERNWSWSVTAYQLTDRSMQEIVEFCHSCQLQGIEGAPPLYEGMSREELKQNRGLLEEADLKMETFHLPFTGRDDLAAFYETHRREAVERMQMWMEKAAVLGAEIVIQHPTTCRLPVETEGLDRFCAALKRSLTELLPVAEELGLTIALENMTPRSGTRFCAKPEHLKRICEELDHPHLGVCLDTGHALISHHERADRFFEVLGSHICAFHLQDTSGDRDIHLAPGRGLVNWQSTFRAMARIDYEGTACIEAGPFAYGPDYSLEAWQEMVSDTEMLAEQALR